MTLDNFKYLFLRQPLYMLSFKNIFWRKKMEKQKLNIRLELKGENAKKFHTIKQRYGLKKNTEIIRFLISQAYAEIEGQKNSSPKK
jgi:hypothetical protein